MSFGFSVITSEGAALCRSAVSGSTKIVFTRAYCGSQYDNDRGDLCNKDVSWFDGAEGTIAAVSTELKSLQVVASFSAVDSGTTPVKSCCICAQLIKEGVSPTYSKTDDIVFAACSDDNSGYINGDSFSVSFNLPVEVSSICDAVGTVPNNAGLTFVSFTPGADSADGVLQVQLANGKVIDIAANEHSEG